MPNQHKSQAASAAVAVPTMLGRGLYTFAEAARLTGLRTRRIREWFRDRPSGSARKAVCQGDYAPVDGDDAISFHDLIDVFVAGQLREHGVALQTLRCVYARLQAELSTAHPFCRKELLSDGKHVFTRGVNPRVQEELMEVLTQQKVFPQILLPFLLRIDYGEISRLAERWHISDAVVIDPAICFGAPIVEAAGIPTAILAAAYQANHEDAELVADWYGVVPDNVLAAVQFVHSIAA